MSGSVAGPAAQPNTNPKRGVGVMRPIVSILVAAAIVLAVFAANHWLPGSIPFVSPENDPEKVEKYSHYLEILLASVDQVVSMLVTVQLSLFVLGGFALNKRLGEAHIASGTLLGFGAIFLITAVMSLTLGYTARIQAHTLIQYGTWHFESVETTVVVQSILVVISAASAICLLLVALLDRNAAIRRTDPSTTKSAVL